MAQIQTKLCPNPIRFFLLLTSILKLVCIIPKHLFVLFLHMHVSINTLVIMLNAFKAHINVVALHKIVCDNFHLRVFVCPPNSFQSKKSRRLYGVCGLGGAPAGGRSLEWKTGGAIWPLGGAREIRGLGAEASVPAGSRRHGGPRGVPGGGGSACWPYLFPDSQPRSDDSR